MDKYTLLILLNFPLLAFGLFKTAVMYKKGLLSRPGLVVRLGFWLLIAVGLILAEEIYTFLYNRGLTASDPLSIADVVLVTGVIFCLALCLRLYSKIEALEQRVTKLQQVLSIKLSEPKRK